MRLTAHQIDVLAFEIAKELVHSEAIEADVEHLAGLVRREITEDLKVEDDLDAEVHRVVQGMAAELGRQGGDFALMFEKVKKQLVRERKLVL